MKAEDLGTGNGAKHDCLPLACPCPLTESTWLAQEDNFHPPHLQNILLPPPPPPPHANALNMAPKTRESCSLHSIRRKEKHTDKKGIHIHITRGRLALFTWFASFPRNMSYLQSHRNKSQTCWN